MQGRSLTFGEAMQAAHDAVSGGIKEKAARERARLAEEKATKLEQEKLEAQGNKDEQIKTLNAQLKEAKKMQKDLYGNIARKTLSAQVKALATTAGCIDPDAVMALSDLSELEVDATTFEADAQDVQAMIADLKKAKPYLFSKSAPKINGKMPNGGTDRDEEKEDLSKLTMSELKKRLAEIDKKSK